MNSIANFVRRVFARLFSGSVYKTPLPFDASMADFLQVDVAKLAKRLEIDHKARQRGEQDLPPTDQQTPDDIELAIGSEVGQIARGAHDALIEHLQTFSRRVEAILASDAPERIKNIAHSNRLDMLAQVKVGTGIVFTEKLNAHKAHVELDNFTRRNGIARPASYPKKRFLLVSILVLLLVIESGANAFLFAGANELGLVGSVPQTIGISFVNLTTGFATGCLLLPQLTPQRILLRTFFGILSLVAVAAIGLFNLFVGHYRDVLTIFAGDLAAIDLGRKAVDQLMETPYGLQDFESWIFVFIGIIFAALALVDGLKWDDIFPGFGERDRMHNRLLEQYNRNLERVQQALAMLAKTGVSDIERIVERAKHEREECQTIVARVANLQNKLAAYYKQLEENGQQLIQRYRQENCAVRNSPAPEFFGRLFVISERPIPDAVFDNLPDMQLVKDVGSVETRKIQDCQSRLLGVYKAIDELTQADMATATVSQFSELVAEVESVADDATTNSSRRGATA